MEIQGLFKLLIVVVLILIVFVVVMGGLSGLDIFGKTGESLTQAQRLALAQKVAYQICKGENRMSSPIDLTLATAGERDDLEFRVLTGTFDCSIEGTEDGNCIIASVYRREWCADGGFWCSGAGDNIGTFEFTVDMGGQNLLYFVPECGEKDDVEGCCIKPSRGTGSDWVCDWYVYELDYFGPQDSLNALVPNGKQADVWSRFADKGDNPAANMHICTYGGKEHKFYTDSYKYKNGRLGLTYFKCCPEGWNWHYDLNYGTFDEGCCADSECTNLYCEEMGGKYFEDYCWIEASPDQSCNDVTPSGAQCAADAALSVKACELHQKYWKVDCPNCQEASAIMNPVAPYMDTTDNTCYYYSEAAHTTNPFDCDAKNSGIKRLCAFESLCPGKNIWGYSTFDVYYTGGTCAGGCYLQGHHFDIVFGRGMCHWNYLGHRYNDPYGDSCVWDDREECPSEADCTDTGCLV